MKHIILGGSWFSRWRRPLIAKGSCGPAVRTRGLGIRIARDAQ